MSTATANADVVRSLGGVYASAWSPATQQVLYSPDTFGFGHDLVRGRSSLADLLPGDLASALLPLAIVDEASLACAVVQPIETGDAVLHPGLVVRVFLSAVDPGHQFAVLDTDPYLYVASLEAELAARGPGLDRVLDEIGVAYEQAYLKPGKRPRDFVVRPVRIACQNVIVALGAIAQDSTFDGLSVPAWQTCEVPHVATHEANRALAALTLCDAFARGGTMEIRFDRPASVMLDSRRITYSGHAEMQVPASLRRFGRARGIAVGAEDPAAITPREARDLFLAVTPMPVDLRARVHRAVTRHGLRPERACYTLLSQMWRDIELDLLLATSDRASSILAGGANWTDRTARQAESDAARAALMAGMYLRRLDGRDSAFAGVTDGVRVVEDTSLGVSWTIDEETSTVDFHLPSPMAPPWSDAITAAATETLTVAPRVHVSDADLALLRSRNGAVLLPHDVAAPPYMDVTVLRCPDRLADLDKAIEAKLLAARISRA